jgi:hypothetical protein
VVDVIVLLCLGHTLWTTNHTANDVGNRNAWFVYTWLVLELVGYFVLTPFQAVRRLLGVVLVATLICGRPASAAWRRQPQPVLLGVIVGFTALLGLGVYALDVLEAATAKSLAEEAARRIRERDGGTVWYVGHWGFQFYAERAGMRPVVTWYRPGETWYDEEGPIPRPSPSRLRRGDWLVVPDWRLEQQKMVLPEDRLDLVWQLACADVFPLKTVMCYYGGNTALEHRGEPTRLEVSVYRVTRDFDPVFKTR